MQHELTPITKDDAAQEVLRSIPLFADLAQPDMDRLMEMSRRKRVQTGEVLVEEGDPGDAMFLVLDGELEVVKKIGTQDVPIDVRKPGEFFGEMALLEQAPRMATVRATTDGNLLEISRMALKTLLACSPSAAMSIMAVVMKRLRNTELISSQNAKMAALGTIAAGLAHELNNPAAAARGSAAQLDKAIDEGQRFTVELAKLDLSPEQAQAVSALRQDMVDRTVSAVSLDPLTFSDRESELELWLEERGVPQAWEVAPTLVTFGFDTSSLAATTAPFDAAQVPVVAQWLAAGFSLHSLVWDVRKSTERISVIVQDMKAYTYLDQSPVQEIDVREGIDNTLSILRYRIEPGIHVTRDYDPDVPRIEAYASDLNQVWTNIIENAVDAMHEHGNLAIRAYRKGSEVVVEITDDGPGIPPEIQQRIFEPLFTTKPPGSGTGVGLYTAYRTVVNKHNGQIGVTSRPGATTFKVTLPIRLRKS